MLRTGLFTTYHDVWLTVQDKFDELVCNKFAWLQANKIEVPNFVRSHFHILKLFAAEADLVQIVESMERDDKMKLVGYCLQQSGFDEITFHDESPLGADPLWIMTGKRPVA